MKKTHVLRYLLCGAMLLSGLSCSDDENGYDPNNVNDPEKLTEPCPTTDELEVTHANSLYYLSAWSEGVHTLSDNMVNRYQETVPYTSDCARPDADGRRLPVQQQRHRQDTI